MPSLSTIPMDQALLIGRAVFLVFCFLLAAVTFTRWRRASDEITTQFFEQNAALLKRLTAIEAQLAANEAQLAEARAELSTIATRTGALAERLEDSEQRRTPAPAASTAPSYQIAIRLARSGAPREEIMSSCGLSRQEAELVQRLHGTPRKLAAAS